MRSLRFATPAFVAALFWAGGCSTNDTTGTESPGGDAQPDGATADGPAGQDGAQESSSTSDASTDADAGASVTTVDDSPAESATSDASADETTLPEAGDAQIDAETSSADASPVCSPPCVHGTCIASGGCSCDPSWGGPMCDMAASVLTPGVSVAGSVTRGNWALFSYYGQATGLDVTLTEDATVGLVWAYLGAGMVPTQSSNLASDENGQSASHTVAYSFASSGMQTWYVAAYGQPAIPTDTQVVNFHLLVTVVP